MRYYYKDNQIHAFSPLQIRQGLADGLAELTKAELEIHLNPPIIEQIPESITMRQCRLQLLADGYLDTIEQAAQQDRAMQIEWEYATVVERSNPLCAAMIQVLELTEQEADNLFLQASKL